MSLKRAIYQHTETSGVDAGESTAGVAARPLDHEEYNAIGAVLNPDGSVTAPPGLWVLKGWTISNAWGGHRTILDVAGEQYTGRSGSNTDESEIARGNNSVNEVTTRPLFFSEPTTISLRQYVERTDTLPDALGKATGSGHSEVYAGLEIIEA